MALNIKLLPVNDVLKLREEGDIHLDQPINLSLDAPEVPPAPPVEAVAPAPVVEAAAESVSAPSGGIEIETPPESFELAHTDEPPAASAAVPPPPEGASIVLSLDEAAEEPVRAPEPVSEAAPPEVEPAAQQVQEISFAAPAGKDEAAQELPYLFSGSGSTQTSLRLSREIAEAGANQAPPVGGSGEMAPGDVETLKNYLAMREQDIAVLKVTLNYTRGEIQKSEDAIRALTQESDDLRHRLDALQSRADALERERAVAGQSMESEIGHTRDELRAKSDRVRVLEEKLKDSSDQYEKLKERVRIDIRKIRVRERELESKLEILKRDSETLIVSRESKILELKRRIDVLEFNCETLLERAEAEKRNTVQALEREARARQALQGAMSILEGGGTEEAGEGKKPGSEIKVA